MSRRRRNRSNPDLVQSKITDGNFNINDYAKSLIETKGTLKGSQASVNGLTNESISTMLNNILSNHERISSAMETMAQKDGLIRAVVNYLSTSLTLNHNIYPKADEKSDFSLNVKMTDYLAAANELDKYNVKFFVPYFIKRTLLKGVSYFYEIKDSSGTIYIEFPNSMCRVSYMENGVYRWMIDTSKIKSELLASPIFPSEIKKAMESGDKSDEKKWVDGKYLLLSDKAVAFSFDMNVLIQGGVAAPETIALLNGALQTENVKKNMELKDDLDTVRIIHGRIPSDRDGNIKMSSVDAHRFQQSLSQGLPDGIAVTVTPFDLENVPLNGAGASKAFDNLKDSQRQLLNSSGFAPQMFGDDTNSSNAIKLSITRDMTWLYKFVLPVFTNYYNYILSKVKTESGAKWRVTFLEQNYFDMKEDTTRFKDAVTLGGSRTDYLASIGMSPLEIYNKLYMEQNVLDIDSIMKPKEMSYTMSGKNGNSGEVGRPKTDNPTDDTERISDAE